jgi:hypothetical protein
MVREALRGRFDPFNLKNPFIVYFIVQFGATGLITLATAKHSEMGLDPTIYLRVYTNALLLSVVGLSFFQFGYYSQPNRSLKLFRLVKNYWKGNRFFLISSIYFVIGFISFAIFISINDGLNEFLVNRGSWRSEKIQGQGFLIFPATGLLVVSFLVYFIGKIKLGTPNRIKLLFFLGLTLFPAWIFGFRSLFVLPIVQVMVVWNYGYKKISSAKLFIVFSVLVVVFTGYGITRNLPIGFTKQQIIEAVYNNPELAYMVISRVKGVEVVTTVMEKIERTKQHDLFVKGIYEAFTIPIPGRLWPGKPEPSSIRFGTYFFGSMLEEARGYEQEVWGGISPTAVGELYWHGGWLGVVIGLYFLGRIGKIAFCTLQKHKAIPSVLLIYAIFYTSYAMFAEAFQGYINGLVLYGLVIIPTLFVLTVSMRAKKKSN